MYISTDGKEILIVGGRGKVAKLATRLLRDTAANVTSLVRTEDSVEEVEALGARALVRDITAMSQDDWGALLPEYDVVVWSAGNGGRGGPDVTCAVDRDGALTVIEALSKLSDPPRFLMVSYVGSLTTTADDDGSSWYAYVESKKAVDKRLLESDLEFLILAPAALTDEPAQGIEIVDNTPEAAKGKTTARELVAEVIAYASLQETLPEEPILPFVDGEDELSLVI